MYLLAKSLSSDSKSNKNTVYKISKVITFVNVNEKKRSYTNRILVKSINLPRLMILDKVVEFS